MSDDVLPPTPAPGAPVDAWWPAWEAALPVLATLKGVPQDPEYHAEGDVWVHTRQVCQALLAHPGHAALEPTRRRRVFLAALLHDIGKPATTREELIDGRTRITSKGHSRRGEVDARILLWRLQFPFHEREQVCRMIGAHQLPFFALRQADPGFVLRQLAEDLVVEDLCLLAEADARGRTCAPAAWQETLDNVALCRQLALELGCLTTPHAFPDEDTRIAYFWRQGAISPDHAFHCPPGAEVIVLCGLPASGKDSWIARHGEGRPVISFDDAIEELGLRHGGNTGRAIHLAIDRAKALLRAKTPFIWNATHLSAQMRAKTLNLIYAYDGRATLVYLEAPEAVLHARNTRRDTTLTNRMISAMLPRWEVPRSWEAHGWEEEITLKQEWTPRRPMP